MRTLLLGLAVTTALVTGAGVQVAKAQGDRPLSEPAMVQPVYWSGEYCGPRCQEYRWWQHRRWEERRQAWRYRRWEERRDRYRGYP